MSGLIRGIDAQRRLTIPETTLKAVGIETGDMVEVWTGQDEEGYPCLYLKKHRMGCILCTNHDVERHYYGKPLCQDCINLIREV